MEQKLAAMKQEIADKNRKLEEKTTYNKYKFDPTSEFAKGEITIKNGEPLTIMQLFNAFGWSYESCCIYGQDANNFELEKLLEEKLQREIQDAKGQLDPDFIKPSETKL